MPRPRDSSSDGEGGDGGRSDSADSSSESNSKSGGSDNSSSSSGPASGTGSSSGSGSSSDSSSPGRGPGARKAIVGYDSGGSSGATSRAGDSRGGSTSSSSSSESSSSVAEGGGGSTLKSRMKALFKKQEVEVAEPEELGDLQERVDAKLLAEVQEYEAAPSEVASYGVNTFWDGHYADDLEVVEWYHPWSNLAPTLTQYMDEQDQVLVCGCGNSEMSVDMFDDGFENIFNADISRVVIDQMVETCKEYPMEWKSVDLTREVFSAEKFDVALDKACLDSIVCSTQARTDNYLQQIDRILQPEGAFICVSFAPPEDRLEMLEYWDLDEPDKCLAWDVHVDQIAKPELQRGRAKQIEKDVYFYIYVCIKDPGKPQRN